MHQEEHGLGLGTGWSLSLKQFAFLLGLVFVAVLAVVIGKQMSAEAMAVVIGIVCGVAAGIPTSALLFVVLTRREQQKQDAEDERLARQQRPGYSPYPPVVVIQGGGMPAFPAPPQAGYWPAPTPGPQMTRSFHVVGDDNLLLDGWENEKA